jgi:hypothetical protein
MYGFTPQEFYTIISDEVRFWADKGKAKNSRKPIHWKKSDTFVCPITHEDRYGIDIWQENGAHICLTIRKREVQGVTVIGSDPRTDVLDGFGHNGQPQKSFDLLATVLAHKGRYAIL